MRRIDPMVRLLILAIVLATALPVAERWASFAQFVSNAAVFLLFFLNGLRLPRNEVIAGMGNWRLLAPLAAFVYLAMPAAGWVLWRATAQTLPPTLALGFLFLGTLPTTVQSSTAYTSLAGGNVAIAVVAAALLSILGVFVTAPLFSLLAQNGPGEFDLAGLAKVIAVLLVPFALGQGFQRWFGDWMTGHRLLVTWMDRLSIAVAVYVAFSSAVRQGIWERIDGFGWVGLIAGCMVLLVAGYGGAWLLGRSLGLARGDRIAMMYAGAQKSVAMGAPLAILLFPPATAGVVLLPTLAYHLAQLMVAAPIASRLRSRAPT